MGEIADALRRARGSRAVEPRNEVEPESAPPVYSRAIDVENPEVRAAAALATNDEAAERHPISRDREPGWVGRAVLADADTVTAEAYRHFAVRVGRELEQRPSRSVMIASALRIEGKTTTACNLALAFATMAGGRRTALIDLDLRKPSVADVFGLQAGCGVEDVLAGKRSLPEVRVRTDLESLDLFPAAGSTANPYEILSGQHLGEMMRELELAYDTVIIDTAPVLLVPDAQIILPHTGGCIAVLRSRSTNREAFARMIDGLPPGKLIGTFLNDARQQRSTREYGHYGSVESASS